MADALEMLSDNEQPRIRQQMMDIGDPACDRILDRDHGEKRLAAFHRGTILDRFFSATAITGVSLPHYWVGIVLVAIFAVTLNALPAQGMGPEGLRILHDAAHRRDPLDPLQTRAGGVLDQVYALLGGRTLYVSGAMNILDHPEFGDLESTRALLRMFEQKERLADLMTVLAGGEGLNVTIGEENPVAEMRECTLITSTYTYRDQVIGVLGVVGPRRLPYPEVISIVNETARHVTDALSRVRQDLYLPS